MWAISNVHAGRRFSTPDLKVNFNLRQSALCRMWLLNRVARLAVLPPKVNKFGRISGWLAVRF